MKRKKKKENKKQGRVSDLFVHFVLYCIFSYLRADADKLADVPVLWVLSVQVDDGPILLQKRFADVLQKDILHLVTRHRLVLCFLEKTSRVRQNHH